ncbi:DUF4055 domain-containing protein [Pantoea agglomerans]|uniref:DUF4055 domain-containing protein n=1 Tax=Enterobacter agglomerans TaxID=549 RepID=UPI00117C06F6|nr:DUF4055 domain-containing protein [Pantoea agglomerans]NKE95235.1 DUF4055 domain-containing protein [Pantoea agglomerans]TRO76773.1 DUF4055 domain-containing protein [Pantoea agglomerans]
MANFSYARAEYSDAAKSWQLVKDCVAGSRAIKDQGILYLPMPDPTNDSDENKARYEALLKRAMFLNITGRTRQGLIGAVFRKTAEVDLPDSVAYLIENASGDGTSLEQLSKEAVGEDLDTGRGGFFVDYPASDAPEGARPTRAQSAGRFAHIHLYEALSIINWREDVINGVRKLTLVVFAECYNKAEADEFSFDVRKQFRALTLEDGVYRHRMWHEGDPYEAPQLDVYPTDFGGKTFDHIPFYFFGAESNDARIDKAPLEDLAEVNVLHYGNSATVEESGFISSQPTLFFTTDIEQAEFEAWNPGGIQIGSTRGYSLGRTGAANMLQANESQLALKLMQEKENQMLMIGARIVQQSGQNETAEAARIRYSSDNSVLGTIAGNVSEALKRAILDAQLYMSGKADMANTVFWLNQEFFDASLTSQDVLALIQSWQQGIIAKSDVRTKFRQTGWLEADRNDDDIDAERAEEPAIEGDAVSDNADPVPEE